MKKQLKDFKKFLKNFEYDYVTITQKEDGFYWKDFLIKDNQDNILSESDVFVNVGYKLKGALPKVLSNLFPYEFVFMGKKVASIESVFQGLKFKDKKTQNYVLKYSGLDSNNIKVSSDYDWKIDGNLFWQGKPINRFGDEYQDFTAELYISALQNPLYRKTIENVKNKIVLHTMGEEDPSKTVFSRHEFEKMLNALVAFIKQ